MMRKRSLLGLAAGFGALAALAGCGTPPPPPVTLTLTIKGGANQNPSPAGTPASVAVRLYQLSAAGKFQSTDIYRLMSQETASLGTEEAGPSEQLLVAPGQTQTVERTLKPGVQFLGVAVLFSAAAQAQWQQMMPVPASGPVAATLTISATTATLAVAK